MAKRRRASKAKSGPATVEIIGQWNPAGELSTRRPGEEPRREIAADWCTWLQARMPEVDAAGIRTTRASWDEVDAELERFGLPGTNHRQRSALGAPLSEKPSVFTALGAFVVRGIDETYGTRIGIRLVRIALVPVTGSLLVSARHRDGVDWIDPPGDADPELLRAGTLRRRDPYRSTSLLSGVNWNRRVSARTSSTDLALEVVLATTQAYPRSLEARLGKLLTEAEQQFVATVDDEGSGRLVASRLLQLIGAIGRLEGDLGRVREDVSRRLVDTDADPTLGAEIEMNFARTMDALEGIRADARTAVEMINSTISSAQLQLARSEAQAAAEERTRRNQEADTRLLAQAKQREREQRLARTVAVLTSVLLIPTLVASVFGANVKLPREETVWKTWLMISCMVGLASATYAVLRELDPTSDPPKGMIRMAPYLLAAIALGTGVAIALNWSALSDAESMLREIGKVI